MSDESTAGGGQGEDNLIKDLENFGFFKQIAGLEGSLTRIAADIQKIAGAALKSQEETESLAAHVLAMESVLAVMLETHPINAEDVRARIQRNTMTSTSDGQANPLVQAIADELLGGGAKKLN